MVNTRARSPWLALRPKEGWQATNPRIASLRRQAGVGRTAGRARSLRRCGHIPAARQSRSQGSAGEPSRRLIRSPEVRDQKYG